MWQRHNPRYFKPHNRRYYQTVKSAYYNQLTFYKLVLDSQISTKDFWTQMDHRKTHKIIVKAQAKLNLLNHACSTKIIKTILPAQKRKFSIGYRQFKCQHSESKMSLAKLKNNTLQEIKTEIIRLAKIIRSGEGMSFHILCDTINVNNKNT